MTTPLIVSLGVCIISAICKAMVDEVAAADAAVRRELADTAGPDEIVTDSVASLASIKACPSFDKFCEINRVSPKVRGCVAV